MIVVYWERPGRFPVQQIFTVTSKDIEIVMHFLVNAMLCLSVSGKVNGAVRGLKA